MLVQPLTRWQGNMETNGEVVNGEEINDKEYANNTTPDPPLTQEDKPRTYDTSQYEHSPHNGANPTEEDPFTRGTKRGALRPEGDLDGCLLTDAANGFDNLSRLTILWMVAHRWPAASRFSFN